MIILHILNFFKKGFIAKILIPFLIISLMGLGTTLGYQRYITYGLLPALVIYLIVKKNYKVHFLNNGYVWTYIFIVLLSILLLLQSVNIYTGLNIIIQLLGVLLASIILFETNYLKGENLKGLVLISFVLGFYFSVFFLVRDVSNSTSIASDWINRKQYDLNANKYSYYSYLANISLFYLIEIRKKYSYIFLSILTTVIGIYISFYTASRSGLLFTSLIAIIYWIFIHKGGNKIPKKLKVVFILVLIAVASQKFHDTFSGSFLESRVSYNNLTEDGRIEIAEDAINVFFEHPFLGVGPGQFTYYGTYHPGSYSHNSFLESATNLGILGLLLMIILFFGPLLDAFFLKEEKYSSLKYLDILFYGSFILYNNLYVFYWSSVEMMFFFFIISLQKNISSNNYRN